MAQSGGLQPAPVRTMTPIPTIPTATLLAPQPTWTTLEPVWPTTAVIPTVTPSPGSIFPVDSQPTLVPLILGPVYQEPYFEVRLVPDVIYGQGLRRGSWYDSGGWPTSLALDVYRPVDAPGLRPSIMLFHGGGFVGGQADYQNMVSTAEYFASRGWVVFSVNYRLEKDYGSFPDIWPWVRDSQIYPAGRDAKAAVRWLHANAATYNVSTAHITALGGSAGGMLALMLGVSDGADYRDELDVTADPTLANTNLAASAAVQTVVVFWGNDVLVERLREYDGRSRYSPDDAPTMLVHGTADNIIGLDKAEDVYFALMAEGVPVELIVLEGEGHAAWDASLADGRPLLAGAFDFVVAQQGLPVGPGKNG